MFRPFRSIVFLCALVFAASVTAQERVLTKAIEVRSLSPAEAESGLQAKLRGVVVYVESPSAIFVQDETSTTFFRVTPPQAAPAVGDEIELTSKTRMGLYLPGLADTTFTVIGHRELPPGIPVQYDDLHFGRYHYQRVAVEGIVRSVLPAAGNRSHVRLAMGSRVIEVRIDAPPPEQSLVDHRVRITGLAAGQINAPRRQLIQPYLRVNDWTEVRVLAPAPPAADVPPLSAEELLAFSVRGLGEQRVRLEGVVTAAFGGELAFLEQAGSAFAVRFGRAATLAPGDRVSVVGFPSMDRFSASVVDAEVLTRTPGPAPAARDIDSIDELYGKSGDQRPGRHDGHLVRVTATVRDAFKSEEGTTLLVQGGRRTATVRLPELEEIPPAGASVRLTAVCQVETAVSGSGFQSRPGLISLRVTSAAGVEVLSTPPWWTPRRLSSVLAVLIGITLLAGLWIASLRRQVRRQTAALRHRIEAEAALEERQRIAREFHDTLEQELAGVSLRLDALATRELDDKGRNLIAASRNLVTRIQTETRDLISDLRDPTESAGDLTAALAAVAARQSADHGVEVRLEPTPPLPPLAATIVHDLRMIARESITNAIRHGRATHIVLEVSAREGELVLRVTDNGCGFDAAMANEGRRGHFGCSGMRERGRKIGAEITWESVLHKGATVTVTVPLRPGTATTPAAAPRIDTAAG